MRSVRNGNGARLRWRRAMALGGLLAACALGVAAGDARAGAYIDGVEAAMKRLAPGLDGTVYAKTAGNAVAGIGANPTTDWLLQTPDCWGMRDCGPNPPAFRRYTATLEDDLSRASRLVDITTLIGYPDGEFHAAIVRGLKATLSAGRSPVVRILGGCYPACTLPGVGSEGAESYAARLARDIGRPRGGEPRIFVAAYRYYTPSLIDDQFSWNHAKIVAVDGRTAIVGGHNMWSSVYLQTRNPIHDVTMRLAGPIARETHDFAGILWKGVCTTASWFTGGRYVTLAAIPRRSGRPPCPSDLTAPAPERTGDVEALMVGKVGLLYKTPGVVPNPRPAQAADASPVGGSAGSAGDPSRCAAIDAITTDYTNRSPEYDRYNPGEEGLRTLISLARSDVLLAQQDLYGVCPGGPTFDRRLLDELVDLLRAGKRVRIVTSSPGARLGLTQPYSNDKESLTKVTSAVWQRMLSRVPDRDRARELMRANLRVAPFRYTRGVATWPQGGSYALIGNHSKVIQVDRSAFYVGSQNLYPAWLSELGVIVDDPAVNRRFEEMYAAPLWHASCPLAIWGPRGEAASTGDCPDPPGAPPPSRRGPAGPGADEDGDLDVATATIPVRRAELDTEPGEPGGTVSLPVRCRADDDVPRCFGNVEIELERVRLPGAREPGGHLTIGRAEFLMAPGDRRTVSVTIAPRFAALIDDDGLRARVVTTATAYDDGVRPSTVRARDILLVRERERQGRDGSPRRRGSAS